MKQFEFGRISILASLAMVCLGVMIALGVARGANTMACTVLTPVNYTFNDYDPTSGTDQTLPTGSVSVECDNQSSTARVVTFNLTLLTSPLVLTDASGNTLAYGLYTDTPPKTPWNGTNAITCNLTLAKNFKDSKACSFYGKIGNSQNVPAGTYSQKSLQVGGTFSCAPSSGITC
jgi:spore coat protein U-like protein